MPPAFHPVVHGDAKPVTRRAHCGRCERPVLACVCPWVCPVRNTVPVLVLQHPGEVRQAKGTASLLALSLARCEVMVGEVFHPNELGLAAAPGLVLLYPEATVPSRQIASTTACQPANRLLVLDGTWRKTYRMMCLNPWIAALPRLGLKHATVSAYRIRRARHSHQLSTLEATCLALGQMEGDAPRYAGLLQGLDGFVTAFDQRIPRCAARAEQGPSTADVTAARLLK